MREKERERERERETKRKRRADGSGGGGGGHDSRGEQRGRKLREMELGAPRGHILFPFEAPDKSNAAECIIR